MGCACAVFPLVARQIQRFMLLLFSALSLSMGGLDMVVAGAAGGSATALAACTVPRWPRRRMLALPLAHAAGCRWPRHGALQPSSRCVTVASNIRCRIHCLCLVHTSTSHGRYQGHFENSVGIAHREPLFASCFVFLGSRQVAYNMYRDDFRALVPPLGHPPRGANYFARQHLHGFA